MFSWKFQIALNQWDSKEDISKYIMHKFHPYGIRIIEVTNSRLTTRTNPKSWLYKVYEEMQF